MNRSWRDWLRRTLSVFCPSRRGARARARTRLHVELLEDRAVPAVYLVTGTPDGLGAITPNGAGGVDFNATTLRGAIIAANATPEADTVRLQAGTYTLTRTGANENFADTGDLDIRATVTIEGVVGGGSVIHGNLTDRVLHVVAGTDTVLTVNDVRIEGGRATGATLGGGGILAESNYTVTLNRSVVTLNQANGIGVGGVIGGGGIYMVSGILTVTESTISDNQANGADSTIALPSTHASGAGIHSEGVGGTQLNVSIARSTVSGNTASGGDSTFASFSPGNATGGGLSLRNNRALIEDSTFSGNGVTGGNGSGAIGDVGGKASGGAIASAGDRLTVTNSTISGNGATAGSSTGGGQGTGGDAFGGGIASLDARVTNTTITKNSVTGGGGDIASGSGFGGGYASLVIAGSSPKVGSTIIAENLSNTPAQGNDVNGPFISLFHNLIGDGTGSTSFVPGGINRSDPNFEQVGTTGSELDPGLKPLADNGGPTQTHALKDNSLALDNGDNALDGHDFDQRGNDFVRVSGPAADVGAFEDIEPVFVALATGNKLVIFSEDTIGTSTSVNITGLATGETLLGIDVRPSDRLLYGVTNQNRVYTINTTSGAATRVSNLSTGLNDNEARNQDNTRGLHVDSAGFFDDQTIKWLRGINNSFNNPWYFITNQGAFFEWDGVSAASGNPLAYFGTDLFTTPELLFQTATPLSGLAATEAEFQDRTKGLYVDHRGFFQGGNGNNVKYLRGVTNASNNPWYFLRPNGDFVAWNGVDETGTAIASFGPAAFHNPELLHKASAEVLLAADLAQAQSLDASQGFYVDEAGFFQSSGSSVKWLRGANNNQHNQPWYFIDPNGLLVAWDGNGLSGTTLHDFDSAVFRKPELLFEASVTTLSGPQAAAAANLDETLGLYVDHGGFFQGDGPGRGNDVKWLRGRTNGFNNPWYFMRPSGQFVAWNGVNLNGTPMETFDIAAFLNPELIHRAYLPPLHTGTLNNGSLPAGTALGLDFDPLTDRLSIVTDNEQSLVVNVATGKTTIAGTPSYGNAVNPNLVGAAFSQNIPNAPAPTFYQIDSNTDMLVIQDKTSGGLTNVGALGVNTGEEAGFDIVGAAEAYAALKVGGSSRFYTINLGTGLATEIGIISLFDDIYGLAALRSPLP